uniref:C2H2-type domain-containing protein n=1 Tax=Anopheles epiroticus TaxID=199890 RepID=A0A182P7J0_9DIPT
MDNQAVQHDQAAGDICLLCQSSSTNRHLLTDLVDTGQDRKVDVICKHFWLSEASCSARYICAECWNVTYRFHKFYLEIERLHSVVDPTAAKQKLSNTTEAKQPSGRATTSEQFVWLDGENEFITNVNEVFVKENWPDSENELVSLKRDEESDEEESNIPLAKLKQAQTSAVDSETLNETSERPSPFPGIGLSLCRINGNALELICHDCYRQQSKATAPSADTRFTFAALLKHYRKVHGKPGYAVCCNRKYTRRRSLKMHLLSHGRKVVYRCLPCGIKFRKQESLDEHNLLIHTAEEEKRYRCDKCEKAFATEHLLHSHGAWHENVAKKNIICSVCKTFFASQPSLEKHRALHHPSTAEHSENNSPSTKLDSLSADNPDEEKLVATQYRTRLSETEISKQEELIKRHCLLHCSQCDYFAESFSLLKQHVGHEHGLRSCDVVCCDRTYSKRQSLYEHCLVHENPDCFRCGVCGKRYSSSRSLQNHRWRIHTPAAERPFRCDVCGETFVKDYLLKQHLVHHLAKHKKLNYCSECERSFTTATVLKCHQQTYHGGGYSLICDICAKGFNSRTMFENHRLTHSVEGTSQLKHQCEQCKKWLRNKKSYQQHRIRCHANDGPVTCKFCGKASVNASALKSHIHLHHAARPELPCTFCGKRFKTALRLREHEATHTGTVLYRCPWCPRTFACGSNMYKHKKAGHPLEWAASVKKRFGER